VKEKKRSAHGSKRSQRKAAAAAGAKKKTERQQQQPPPAAAASGAEAQVDVAVIQRQIEDLYAKHNPSKLGSVGGLMDKYLLSGE
jgi:hypothetical protein